MKKLLIILGIIAAVLIVGLVLAKSQGWIGQEKLTKVAAEQAKEREVLGMVSATGKIYPETEVKISPDVPGEIIELYVEEGDSVKQGQLLLKIKADDYQNMIDRNISTLNNTKAGVEQARANVSQAQARASQAEARVNNAKADLSRSQDLYDNELISKKELEAADLAYKSAQSDYQAAQQSVKSAQQGVKASEYTVRGVATDVRTARENYSKTLLRAPMTGVVSALNVEKGERVVGTSQMQGTELLRIANLKNMECRIEVSENDIVRVNIGDSCNIRVEAYRDKVFKGIVTQIANSAGTGGATNMISNNQLTNYYVTVIILPESYADLTDKKFPFRPGMSADVDIITERETGKLTVPIQSVTARSDGEVEKMKRKAEGKSTAKKKGKNDAKKVDEKTERKEYVFAVKGGVTKLIPVKTDIQDDDYIIVTEGLNTGDTVVTAPYNAISRTLKIDEKVEIVDKSKVYN